MRSSSSSSSAFRSAFPWSGWGGAGRDSRSVSIRGACCTLALLGAAAALTALGCAPGSAGEGADTGDEPQGRIGTSNESQVKAPSGPLLTTLGTLDVEAEYLPRVVAQEIAGVTHEPEALKAQAVAARTFLARALADSVSLGRSRAVPCDTTFQDCAAAGDVSAAVRAAVAATKGEILTYEGKIITANFDAGAKRDANGVALPPSSFGYPATSWAAARAQVEQALRAGSPLYGKGGAVIAAIGAEGDPVAWTELYVTDNAGKHGAEVTPTLQAFGSAVNRGAMSQWGAISLAQRGRDYRTILRAFYGADVAVGANAGDPTGAEPGSSTEPNANPGGAPASAGVTCSTDEDCHHGAHGVGVVCANSGAQAHTCVEACHTDADCPESDFCDQAVKPTWQCSASWPALGTSCTGDDECGGPGSGRVCANSGTKAGTCIVGCHGDGSCPTGSTCDETGVPWICVGAASAPAPAPAPTKQSAPKDVPYECQYSNGINEGGAVGGNTCATTSTAMALRYFGIDWTAKQYFDAYRALGYTYNDAKSFSLIPTILNQLPATKGKFQTRSLTSGQGGTTADLKKALDEGYLVVVGANLFQGHVVLVTGYDEKGVYVNDPAGIWHPSLGNTGAAYDRCYGTANNAKGDFISWGSYQSRNVFCGENLAVHLCGAKADLWMMAIKKK
jgi:hypothetical protein